MSADDAQSGKLILVTGGTGFIGRHVVANLVAQGHRVRLPYRHAVPEDGRERPEIEPVAIDDLMTAPLQPLVDGASAIVHLAGLAHIAKGDRETAVSAFTEANEKVTERLVAAALEAQTPSFIHLSSLAAVTPNTSASSVDDSTDVAPTTPYGRSKRAAEGHVRRLAEAGHFAVSLRPPLVVGAEAKGNWRSLQKLAATGLPLPFAALAGRRSFIGVEALADAIALLCGRFWSPALSGDYCIADPDALSLPEVLTELRRGMGLSPRLFPCPPQIFDALGMFTGRRRQLAGLTGALQIDGSRFATTFGYRPRTPIRAAIQQSGRQVHAHRAKPLAPDPELPAPGPVAPAFPASPAKRLIDLALGLCVGVVALPFVLLAMGAIRLTSPGPALFRQVRIGLNEQPFVCLKLRTMRQDTRNAPSHEVSAASVTPLGRFLRRTKLDELPQLWNIVKGEMSFVGPRPCLPTQSALIEARRAHGLYALRPGITGVAQVAGVDMSDPARLAALDATYLDDPSLAHDLKLIAATFLGAGRGDRVKTTL